MKNKIPILTLIALIMLLCMPLAAMAGEEKTFPAGSLIIPMDSDYQGGQEDVNDGGLLEAYGLIYYLLNHTDAEGENDIAVYWVINEEKTTIDGIDLVIEVDQATLGEYGADAVAKLYDHAGGTYAITTFRSGDPGDSDLRMSYLGGPFIVDGADAEKAKTIINQSGWASIDVHEAQVPFAALVHREMRGTPPKIALMNSDEDKTKGNAQILEAYLRLAGICEDVYDILTPNEIRDGKLHTGGYDFLWAPHWDGYKNYDVDGDGNGTPDVDDIVGQVKTFLENGNGLLAECASIETFEHSQNGHFLTTKGIGHDGATKIADAVLYNDPASANSQIADFDFGPEGGHLPSWRPFVSGDPYKLAELPDVTGGNSEYVATVTRFVVDDTNDNDVVDDTDWDYYVGGYAFGDTRNGYVVYLGGHKYAECKGGSAEPSVHPLEFEFKENPSDEEFTLLVKYDSGSETTVAFTAALPTAAKTGDPLEFDLTTASVNKKKLKNVIFRNIGESTITVDSISLSWQNGAGGQKLRKITDTTTDVLYVNKDPGASSGAELPMTDFTIDPPFLDEVTCTDNADCSWKNMAGVRYVLNTIFNIKFQIQSREYVRSAPVVNHPYLYQGTFEYPNFFGHFRRYDVTGTGEQKVAQWDTADGNIPGDNNRNVYTAENDGGSWSKIAFDDSQINNLRAPLGVTPDNGDDQDELDVITRVRGHEWDPEEGADGAWVERDNKLGGIMHSAPVIVEHNSRTGNSRTEIAYVGDLYGMLHAINIANGEEKWAFIPPNLLGKLKNDRTDPNAVQDFAGVDGSPTAKDIYYDQDGDGYKEWRTILVCPEGSWGNYIFALDVTDPDNWSLLWEITDTVSPGMGPAYRTAISKVKWPVYEGEEITGYEIKWVVFVATRYASKVDEHGGINVFAYDLKTGAKLWKFSQEYADSVNDIPGAVTLFDIDDDTFVDRVYVGDMNGRMWELNALDGTNPNGTEEVGGVEKQIPLWNCGVGNPISVSPAIIKINPVVVVFGTGGTDWATTADDKRYYIYAINATDKQGTPTYAGGAGTQWWEPIELATGEKVWSSPTIAAGQIYLATAFGTMESSNPHEDLGDTGKLHSINLEDGTESWSIDNIGKTRGSLYVDRQHAYLTTIDNEVIQVGGGDFSEGTVNNVVLRAWRQIQ